MNTQQQVYFLGVKTDNLTMNAALGKVAEFVRERTKRPKVVCFTNVHSIYLSLYDDDLRRYINHADLALADGVGVKLAGLMLGSPIHENLNGTDFTPLVLELAANNHWSVYLVGAAEETVQLCAKQLQRRYPALHIAGFHNGYFNKDREREIIADINDKCPDILLVGMGSPLQEKWIHEHAENLDVGVCFGVGGLFDFLSGTVKRAPWWMRKIGIEWMYRFVQKPSEKWNRVIIEIPSFLPLVFFGQLLPEKIKSIFLRS